MGASDAAVLGLDDGATLGARLIEGSGVPGGSTNTVGTAVGTATRDISTRHISLATSTTPAATVGGERAALPLSTCWRKSRGTPTAHAISLRARNPPNITMEASLLLLLSELGTAVAVWCERRGGPCIARTASSHTISSGIGARHVLRASSPRSRINMRLSATLCERFAGHAVWFRCGSHHDALPSLRATPPKTTIHLPFKMSVAVWNARGAGRELRI